MKRIFPLAMLILFEAIADIFAKTRSDTQMFWYSILSLSCYVISNIFWLFALKNGSGLGRGAVIFSVASAILALGIGFFMFKEHFSSINIVGVLIGLVAIVLLSI